MYLCLDTVTKSAGVALVDTQKVYVSLVFPEGLVAESILELVDQALTKAKVTLKDLKGVLVIIGPGSFTSLRSGIAAANQFAHQLHLPIIGFKTDEWSLLRTDQKKVHYLQSMNRSEVYADGKIIPAETLASLKKGFWMGELTDLHKQYLHELQEIHDLRDSGAAWLKAVQVHMQDLQKPKTYQLLEPYYGKGPAITQAKRAFGFNFKKR